MTNPDKRCGTCKWFNENGFKMGDCEFPIDALPDSYGYRSLMFAEQGTDCPCWQPKAEVGNE